jgi:L-ascorbate metabolism protein UlaG (beta-lactamase superfamily)
MPNRFSRAIAALLVALAAAGCWSLYPVAYQVEPVPDVYGCSAICPDSDQVAVTYLGVSGFTIAYRGRVMMTAPLFSNPGLNDVTPRGFHVFWRPPPIAPDTHLIERLLPANADSASMIVVGHGHYDHLLDVPYIADHHARDAVIVGGPTVRHILMGDSLLRAHPSRVLALEGDDVGSATRAGRWIYDRDSSFRVMALVADHAPTLRFLFVRSTFARGTLGEDLTRLPRTAEEWKLGEPYSYVIDVLKRGTTEPRFRIYFQDAPNSAPKGFPPPLPALGGRPFDLAIVCVATADNVRPVSPGPLLERLQPRYVIASHWESFFRPQTQPLMLNPASHVETFMAAVERSLPSRSMWVMPSPRTRLRYFAP